MTLHYHLICCYSPGRESCDSRVGFQSNRRVRPVALNCFGENETRGYGLPQALDVGLLSYSHKTLLFFLKCRLTE